MLDEPIRKRATISQCGRYRYRLTRYWGPGHMLPFVMLNPSTTDAEVDDPTIRRCMSFARREGAGGIIVANLYALRSTDPAALREVNNPFGPANDQELQILALEANGTNMPIVCAWGTHGTIHNGNRAAIDQFQKEGARLVCLGKTKHGHPRHPLYVKGDQPLVPFP